MTKISIVTALYGEQYSQYLTRWWEAVKALQVQPTEIVLATTTQADYGLFDSVPMQYEPIIKKVRQDSTTVHGPWYEGVKQASGDWIFALGVDDQFSPDAFNEVAAANTANAQLIIDKVTYLQGGSWEAVWQPERYNDRYFAPAGVAGYHRSIKNLWDKIPADLRWNDYAFYLLCVKNKVRVYKSSTTRMIHDLGTNHKTISGVHRDQSLDRDADGALDSFKKSLGL